MRRGGMGQPPLQGLRAAVIAGPDYEDLELHYPLLRLIEAGAEVEVIAPEKREYRGKKGLSIEANATFRERAPEEFDILVIPGGWMPDRVRRDRVAVEWVRRFVESGRPVGCICHGGQLLISARVVRGVRMTAVSAIRDDLENAGAVFVDEPVVIHNNLVTSRVPQDLPFFMRELILLASRLRREAQAPE